MIDIPQRFLEKLSEKGESNYEYIMYRDSVTYIKQLILYIFLAMVYLGPLMSVRDLSESGAGNISRQAIYLGILVYLCYISIKEKASLKNFILPIPVVISFFWAFFSVLWAINTEISFRRLFLTFDIFLSILLFSKIIKFDQISKIAKISLMALLIVNYVFVLFFPDVGIHPISDSGSISYGHNWRGIMAHKNFAGATCAILIIYCCFDQKSFSRFLNIFIVMAASYFLYETQSKTSAGVAVVAIIAGYCFAVLSGNFRVFMVIGLAIFSLCSAIISIVYADSISGGLLHPRSFTGRGQIWAAMLRYCQDNPIFGTGFGSFWNIGYDSPIYHYTTGFATTVTVGHNGYLDLAATIGVPGLILVVAAMLIIPFAKVIVDDSIDRDRGSLFVAILVFTIGHNVTESSVFDRDSIVGVFLSIAICSIYSDFSKKPQLSKQSLGDELVRSVNRSDRRSRR